LSKARGISRVTYRRARPEDFSAILRIQEANFVENLAPEERGEGFLSATFTRDQLEAMARDVAVLVASDGESVVGFLCASGPGFNHESPLVTRMMRELTHIEHSKRPVEAHRFFMYGPVCIDRPYRGRGLLRGLYDALLQEAAGKYDIGVAFVAEDNPHSLRAHVQGLGMVEAGQFECGGHRYKIMIFNLP
jgi:L-amino acid N-acyltransferase YncA